MSVRRSTNTSLTDGVYGNTSQGASSFPSTFTMPNLEFFTNSQGVQAERIKFVTISHHLRVLAL